MQVEVGGPVWSNKYSIRNSLSQVSNYNSCNMWDNFDFVLGAVHCREEAGEQWRGVPRGADVLWAEAVLRHHCV